MPTNIWPFLANTAASQAASASASPSAPTAAAEPAGNLAGPGGPQGPTADDASAPSSPTAAATPAHPALSQDDPQTTATAPSGVTAPSSPDGATATPTSSSAGDDPVDACIVAIAPAGLGSGATEASSSPNVVKELPADPKPRGAVNATPSSSAGDGTGGRAAGSVGDVDITHAADGAVANVTRPLRARGDDAVKPQPEAQSSQQLKPQPSVLQRVRSRGAGTIPGSGAGGWDSEGCVFVENALLDSYSWHGIKKLYAYGIFFIITFLAVW